MRRISLFFFFGALLLPISAATSRAEETAFAFSLAPSPVASPIFEAGKATKQSGGNAILLSVDMMNERLTVVGAEAYGSYRYCPTDRSSVSAGAGGSFAIGNRFDFLMAQAPLFANAVFELAYFPGGTVLIFGGFSGDLGLTSMTVAVPQPVPNTSTYVDDQTSSDTLTLFGSVGGGAQINIEAGDFLLSPYASYTYGGGTHWTSTKSAMSYEYPSISGDLDPSSNVVVGFDALYVPLDFSLCSSFRNTDRYALLSLGFKWLTGR